MSSWILVPSLVSLRAEFNRLAPSRDKASDGSIGDATHAGESSDHNPDETGNTPSEDADNINEVHAIDVDDDLRKSGWTMAKALGIIITRHRLGLDNRLQNVIYNRQIWSRSWGWTARAYNGASAHTEHAHFSNRYDNASEANTKPWGLLAAEPQEWDEMATRAEVLSAVEEGVDSVLTSTRVPWSGSRAGARIEGRGWADMTRDQREEYLLELIAADDITQPDGTKISGSLFSRVSRVEAEQKLQGALLRQIAVKLEVSGPVLD